MKVQLLKAPDTDLDIVIAARASLDQFPEWEYEYRCVQAGCREPNRWGRTREAIATERELCSIPGRYHCWGRVPASRRLAPRDAGTIRFMMREYHGTPFEHVIFRFYIQTSIKAARDIFRHRHASLNERSTRYVVMPDRLDLPRREDIRGQRGKPGHYEFYPLDEGVQRAARQAMEDWGLECFKTYHYLMDEFGLARELASGVLSLWTETSFVMTVNLRSLFNFLSLRASGGQALKEVQLVADEMESLVRPIVPVAMGAWDERGRPNGDQMHDCDQSCDYHLEPA